MRFLIIVLIGMSVLFGGESDQQKYAEIPDKYAAAYVPPTAGEGGIDGKRLIKGKVITEWAHGPIEGVDDPTLKDAGGRGEQVGVVSYSIVVSTADYEAFKKAGGSDNEIEGFVRGFAKKYEIDSLKLRQAFHPTRIYIDTTNRLRNEFYEGVAEVFKHRTQKAESPIQKIMFYRNIQLLDKLSAEEQANMVKASP
jgi:hypothetical protein